MRLLFCNYEYPPLGGGGGVVNAALARELARSHAVTVLTSRAFDLPEESIEEGVRVLRVPVLFRRARAAASLPSLAAYVAIGSWRGRELVRRGRFDVINTHFALPSGPVGQYLARRAGIPNVLSVHGGDLYDPSKKLSAHRHAALRACVRRIARAADAVVAQSRNTADNLRRWYAPEIEPEIIPLGIERPPAVARDRAAHGFRDEDVVLATVGRLVARKAVEQLLEVVAALGDSRVRLAVVGSGPELPALEARAAALGVTGQVRFAGEVDDREKHGILASADVYVSTSQHEGFGLVFLEAMAAGLPIVCYDHGGQRDFLEDGRTGFVLALNDLDGFVGRCRELLASPERRQAIGDRNRELAEQFFIGRCARRYEALFERVVRQAGRAAEPAMPPEATGAP